MVQTGTPPSVRSLGAAEQLYDASNLTFDIVNDYPWTLSRNSNALRETPYVILREFVIDESVISNQISFYSAAFNNVREDTDPATGSIDPLSPYEGLYVGSPNNNYYVFPYFSDINFQVETPVWQTLDALEQGKKAATGTAGLLFGQTGAKFMETFLDVTGGLYTASLATQYPKVGIMDRPRLWERHEFRTIEIKFPLFNTLGPNDWIKNRQFCWTLVNQNLFRKRDFITGIPPVYYDVLIPGQHYSLAACVTNITIYNRGNMRNLTDEDGLPMMVPDVYEVNITLTDMTMPSRNLLQAIKARTQEIVINNNRTSLVPAQQAQPTLAARALNALGSAVENTIEQPVDTLVAMPRRLSNAATRAGGAVVGYFTGQ